MGETAHAAAFFDLDRTLIRGSSAFTIGLEAWRHDLLSLPTLARAAVDAALFAIFGASDAKSEATRDRLLAGGAGRRVDEVVDALADDVVGRLIPKVRPEASALLGLHGSVGHHRYIVSAAPQQLTDLLAEALGLEGSIGTRPEIDHGHYTGRLTGRFVYGSAKADAVSEFATNHAYDLDASYAYSDSASDLPLLETVGNPIAVNPDRDLRARARTRGWPTVTFHTGQTVRRLGQAAGLTTLGAAATVGYLIGRHNTTGP